MSKQKLLLRMLLINRNNVILAETIRKFAITQN